MKGRPWESTNPNRCLMKSLSAATVFLGKAIPFFQECAKGTFDDVSLTLSMTPKALKASLIRIEADSLTYVIHIIIRYEIENDL